MRQDARMYFSNLQSSVLVTPSSGEERFSDKLIVA